MKNTLNDNMGSKVYKIVSYLFVFVMAFPRAKPWGASG